MSAFQGTRALLANQLRGFTAIVLMLGGLGLFIGLMMRLARADASSIRFALLLAAVLGVIFGPVFAGAGLTLPVANGAGNNGGFTRRDALLLLPAGRLALPSTIFLASLAFGLVCVVMFALGLGLTLGPLEVGGALASRLHRLDTWGALAGLGGAWLVLTSLIAIGPHRAGTLALWLAPLFGIMGLLPVMGYGEGHMVAFVALVGGPLALVFLIAPFVLYLRPRHLWFQAKKDMTARFDGWTTMAALLTALLFGIGGFGFAAVGVLLSAIPVVRAWRKAPEAQRRRTSHLRLVHTAAAVVTGATLLVAAGIDAVHVARTDDLSRGVLSRAALSPDGRYLALEVLTPSWKGDPSLAIKRIHLLDLLGERPPRVFAPRFASLASDEVHQLSCWSRDGRYLAFLDHSWGRLAVSSGGLTAMFGSTQRPWELTLAAWHRSTADAIVFDLESGEQHELEGVLFAQGWESPQGLARVSVDLRGRVVVRTGLGAEVRLDPRRVEHVAVVGYAPGGPLLETGQPEQLVVGQQVRLQKWGLPSDRGLICLSAQGPSEHVPAADDDGWHGEVIYLGPQHEGGRAFDSVYTDGERSYRFPSEVPGVPLGPPVEGKLLVLAGERTRLRELDLETGAWRELAAVSQEGGKLLDVRRRDDGAFFRDGPSWYWVRVGDAAPTALPAWVQEPREWAQDGRLLAKNKQGGLVLGAEDAWLVRLASAR